MVVQRDDAIHPLHADDWLAVGFMPSMGEGAGYQGVGAGQHRIGRRCWWW